MIIHSDQELEALKKAGRVVAVTLKKMMEAAEPGMTTKELDTIGAQILANFGAHSAPIQCYNFPGATCICINEEIAHGIPSDRKIQPGDLINVDVSAELNGYYADTGASFVIPPISKEKASICKATQKALKAAMSAVKAGEPVNIIGFEIEKIAKTYSFKTLHNLGSHGIGKALHEKPEFIPGYFEPRDRRILKEGQVITIEPFLSTQITWAKEGNDGWTLLGPEGNLTAQFEHTMVITKNEPIVLTIA